MAWTHSIKSTRKMYHCLDNQAGDAIVAIDRSIYVIGYQRTKKEMRIYIFRVDTATWDILRFINDNNDSIPWEMEKYFAVAHGDSILVYAENYSNECSLYIFNTKNVQWNRLSAVGAIPQSDNWWGGCVLHGELYIIIVGASNYELWALDLDALRWRHVSDIDLKWAWGPLRIVAYGTCIYVHLENIRDQSNIVSIVYYDTEYDAWDWLDSPYDLEFSQPPWHFWASFFYSKHFYFFSFQPDLREIAFSFSLERQEWGRIRIEGVLPLGTFSVGNVIVIGKRAFFVNFRTAVVHVLDLEPSLKTRCLAAVTRYKLNTSCIPKSLQKELLKYKYSASDDV